MAETQKVNIDCDEYITFDSVFRFPAAFTNEVKLDIPITHINTTFSEKILNLRNTLFSN